MFPDDLACLRADGVDVFVIRGEIDDTVDHGGCRKDRGVILFECPSFLATVSVDRKQLTLVGGDVHRVLIQARRGQHAGSRVKFPFLFTGLGIQRVDEMVETAKVDNAIGDCWR